MTDNEFYHADFSGFHLPSGGGDPLPRREGHPMATPQDIPPEKLSRDDMPIITPEGWAAVVLETFHDTFPDLPMPRSRPTLGPRSRKPVQQALPFALPLFSHMGLQESSVASSSTTPKE